VDGHVSVDLVAKWSFSIFDEKLDITEAMDGPKGIMVQLRGMYKVREDTMEPNAGPAPAPLSQQGLRFDKQSLPMGDSFGDRMTPGAAMVADPRQDLLREVARRNDSMAPMGHRFDK
jgi:hypothetical protein